jgi:hypothetical protein
MRLEEYFKNTRSRDAREPGNKDNLDRRSDFATGSEIMTGRPLSTRDYRGRRFWRTGRGWRITKRARL